MLTCSFRIRGAFASHSPEFIRPLSAPHRMSRVLLAAVQFLYFTTHLHIHSCLAKRLYDSIVGAFGYPALRSMVLSIAFSIPLSGHEERISPIGGQQLTVAPPNSDFRYFE